MQALKVLMKILGLIQVIVSQYYYDIKNYRYIIVIIALLYQLVAILLYFSMKKKTWHKSCGR